jgi:hypothetical protein
MRSIFVIILSATISTTTVIAGPAAKKSTAAILAIHAVPYFHETGKFDDVYLEDGAGAMNLPNDDKKPSRITFVTVEVAPDEALPDLALEVVVKAGAKKLASQKLDYLWTNRAKKIVAPLLVYDTGCADLKVTATLRAKGLAPIVKTADVLFRCGE